jgi:hypothetical protein
MSNRRAAGGGRAQRWLAVAAISALLVATAAAFAITERLKLTRSPIVGTRARRRGEYLPTDEQREHPRDSARRQATRSLPKDEALVPA